MTDPCLRIEGLVQTPRELTCADLAELAPDYQVPDVRQLDPRRPGGAVRLAGLLECVQVLPQATHLGLHGSRDNFHASIPLAPVRERGVVIYLSEGQPLPESAGGPFRFFIPDHAACHADEIDECANVKFLDRIELTQGKGFDNRPEDDDAHAKLHEDQA